MIDNSGGVSNDSPPFSCPSVCCGRAFVYRATRPVAPTFVFFGGGTGVVLVSFVVIMSFYSQDQYGNTLLIYVINQAVVF